MASKFSAGQKYGRLTLLGLSGGTNKHPRWMVRCDCGTEKEIQIHSVTSGGVSSCGCLRLERLVEARALDLTGKRVGMLTVLKFYGVVSGRRCWACICDCGNGYIGWTEQLSRSRVGSCGCTVRSVRDSSRKDLAGSKFGSLVAMTMVELVGVPGNSAKAHWVCRCSCGDEVTVAARMLRSGRVTSCGCRSHRLLTPEQKRITNNAAASRRRAREANAGGSFTRLDVERIYALQKGRCANCRKLLGSIFHRDHREPLSKGGSNDASNIDLLCPRCNLSKKDREPHVWARINGKLI